MGGPIDRTPTGIALYNEARMRGLERRGLRRDGIADAPPTDGTWTHGSRVWNLHPAPGGWVGWVCVTPGTPGTWKGFGAIEA